MRNIIKFIEANGYTVTKHDEENVKLTTGRDKVWVRRVESSASKSWRGTWSGHPAGYRVSVNGGRSDWFKTQKEIVEHLERELT